MIFPDVDPADDVHKRIDHLHLQSHILCDYFDHLFDFDEDQPTEVYIFAQLMGIYKELLHNIEKDAFGTRTPEPSPDLH